LLTFTSDNLWLKYINSIKLREGYALPDSQAGHFRSFELRGLFRSNDEQNDSSHEREPAKYRRNGNSVMFLRGGVDRADIEYFFLMGIVEALIGEAKRAQNY